MRGSLALTLLLVAPAALAGAPERYVVAPAGECAGEERELVLGAQPKALGEADDADLTLASGPLDRERAQQQDRQGRQSRDGERGQDSRQTSRTEAPSAPREPGAPQLPGTPIAVAAHLTPTQVAATPTADAPPLPLPPAFAGPDACDEPGSGCVLKSLEDPDPGSGCGMPGSNCP